MEPLSGHVIVCGLNTLGFRVAEQLHLAEVPLVVVDDHYDAALARRLERWGVPFVPESSHASEALLDVGITQATALIACANRDLSNLETVLLAAELAPELRQVVWFANPRLGDQVRAAVPGIRVLSLSGKAGPSFVEACIRSDVLHAFRLDGETMQVVDVPVDVAGPFRGRYGNLTPISLRRGDDPPIVCPGRDTPVAHGDRLALLGRVGDFGDNDVAVAGQRDTATLAALTEAGEPTAPAVQPSRSFREWAADLRATVGGELDRPFRIALTAVLVLIGLSTLILSLYYQNRTVLDPKSGAPKAFDPLDALYFTVSTIATVGFGDYNFAPENGWLKVFGIGLIVVGVVSLSTVYAFITNVVVTRRLERTFGRGRATLVRGHTIVCGFGSVGLAVAEGLLAAGRRVVVVESDENNRYLPVARSLGIPVVLGDATVSTTLEQAGLRRASTLAAMTSDDVANLETVLSARDMFAAEHEGGGDLRVVLRIFDTELADEIERRFGIHTARSASALAAPWFVGAALGYEVISTFYVDRQPFIVARMRVTPGGGLDGPALSDLTVGTRVFAFASHHGRATAGEPAWDYRPTRHTRLAPGDHVLVVGPAGRVITTFRRNQSSD